MIYWTSKKEKHSPRNMNIVIIARDMGMDWKIFKYWVNETGRDHCKGGFLKTSQLISGGFCYI
jgi:hypothetical protein